MKRSLLTIIFAIMSIAIWSQITVDQKIDTMQILIGEQTHMTVSVTLNPGINVKFPNFQRSQYVTPGVEVLECSKIDSVKTDDNKLRLSRSYLLTSFDEQVYRIPSLPVIVGGKTYMTKPLALKVLTVPVDTLNTKKFYPPKDVQNNPFSWSEWLTVVEFSFLFVVALVLAVYLTNRLMKRKPVVKSFKIVKHIPAHQKALVEIERLKNDNTNRETDQKQYYTELTTILRQYIAERFGFDAMEMTSSQIISRLRSEGNSAIDEVSNLFRTADLVKFAKYSVLINESDQNLMSALSFINDTKKEETTQMKVVTQEDVTVKDESNKRLVLKITIAVAALISGMALAAVIYRLYTII